MSNPTPQIPLRLLGLLLLGVLSALALRANTPPFITCPPDVTIECSAGLNPLDENAPDYNPDLGVAIISDCSETPFIGYTDEVLSEACPKIIARTWSGSAAQCAPAPQCTQMITMNDTEAPTMLVFDVEIMDCANEDLIEETIGFSLLAMGLSIEDNCTDQDDVIIGFDYDPEAPYIVNPDCNSNEVPYLTKEATWELSDACGNTFTESFSINIYDVTPPEIIGEMFEVECQDPDRVQKVLDWVQSIEAVDDCGEVVSLENNLVLSILDPFPSCGSSNAQWVTFTATDQCGNIGTRKILVRMVDNLPPVVTCPPEVTVELTDLNSRLDFIEDWKSQLTVEDCNEDYQVIAEGTFHNRDSCPDVLEYFLSVVVLDGCEVETHCFSTVTFEDTTPPDIQCPAPAAFDCDDPDLAEKINSFLSSVEFHDESTTVLRHDFFPNNMEVCEYLGEHLITFTAIDKCFNSSTCTSTLTINPAPPIIECPQDVTVECFEDIAPETLIDFLVSPCSLDVELDNTQLFYVSGVPKCAGSVYKIVYTAIDECGLTSTCDQFFTIENEAPQVSCAAETIVECAEDIVLIPDDDITVITSCGFTYQTKVYGPNLSGPADCPNTTYTYTYEIEDDCGRFAYCQRVFRIQNVGPTLSGPAGKTVTCETDIVTDLSLLNYTSSCGLDVNIEALGPNLVSGKANCAGAAYEVTYVLTDACGRTATHAQYWDLNNEAPIITHNPPDLTVECSDEVIATPHLLKATVACELGYQVYASAPQPQDNLGDCPGAEYLIQYELVDECGRSAQSFQTFTIDNPAPRVIPPEGKSILCLEDIDAKMEYAEYESSCGIPIVQTELIGPSYQEEEPFCQGSVVNYLYSVWDACGRMTCEPQTFTFDFSKALVLEDLTVGCDKVPPVASLRSCIDAELKLEESVYEEESEDYSIHREYTLIDPCGNEFTFHQKILVVCDAPLEKAYCTYTDEEWGDRAMMDKILKDRSQPLLSPDDPLILGIEGERALIVEEMDCIYKLLPGWGVADAFPEVTFDAYANEEDCRPEPLSYNAAGNIYNLLASQHGGTGFELPDGYPTFQCLFE